MDRPDACRRWLFLGLFLILPAASPAAAAPAQFIAKTYTEALGRIPDQAGYRAAANFFDAEGCSGPTLRAYGRTVYLSGEYSSRGYDPAARVLTLYRGVLNREPDAGGLAGWVSNLNNGMPWATVVDSFFGGVEFAGLVSSICNFDDYGFRNAPVIDLPTTGGGFRGGTGAQLQAILNATSPGGVVFLAQKAVVRLSDQLTLPPGVTLATVGRPNHRQYAKLGRLVRVAHFPEAAVALQPGARLEHVWVDGGRAQIGYQRASFSVLMLGGANSAVISNRIGNSAGGSNLLALGSNEGHPCTNQVIRFNLVTAYSSRHTDLTFSDGIGASCEDALIENNEVVDATDVALILFRATPATQASVVRNNQVLAAGNSAWGGLVVDGLLDVGTLHDFSGASFENNLVWSGNGHYEIGLSAGTRAWFGARSDAGRGARFINNSTGSERMRANTGIVVSGMFDATVTGNRLRTVLVNTSFCPTLRVAASVSAGFASGTIQRFTDVLVSECQRHR